MTISPPTSKAVVLCPAEWPEGQLAVFNLDTLAPVGAIAGIKAGGAAVDPKSHHGFSTTKPLTMWDSDTLKVIKTIDVDGRPDGIMFDPFNERVWVLSHMPPYATVIDANDATVAGTVDVGGQPEQAVSDGKGTVYVTIMDKANVAVVDAKHLTVTTHLDLSSKGSAPVAAWRLTPNITFSFPITGCRLPRLIVNA